MSTIEARRPQLRTSALPAPRGPLSESVLEFVTGRSARLWSQRGEAALDDADAQLALWLLNCLDVAVDWEVRSERARAVPLQLLHLNLSRSFEHEIQGLVPAVRGDIDLGRHLDRLVAGPSIDLAATAAARGSEAVRDVLVAAAPHLGFAGHAHTLALARLEAPLQPLVAEIQAAEYGVGQAQTRAQRYRSCLAASGLTYTEAVATAPTGALAFANLAWMFGREVRWRGAAVGQLCLLGLASFDVPVAADRRHEQIVRERLVPELQARTPWLVADAAFGADASWTLQQRTASELLARWRT